MIPQIVHADLVILRATAITPCALDEFFGLTTRVANLLNSRPVVAWNVERRYLRDLMGSGADRARRGVCAGDGPVATQRLQVCPTIGTYALPGSAEFVARNARGIGQRCSRQPGVFR